MFIVSIIYCLCLYMFSVFPSATPTQLPSVYPSLSPSAVFFVSTVAGTGSASYSGDNGAATSAALNSPFGVGVDVSGRQLRKHYVYSFCLHSVSISYLTLWPFCALGNVYIADRYSYRIRKLTVSTGIISTIAGTGSASYTGDNVAATSAALNNPQGVAVDSSGKGVV
jgi:hypothetical protein